MTMLESLRASHQEIFGEDDDPDAAIAEMYIGKKDSCVPDSQVGDDLTGAIYQKFYTMADAIREQMPIRAEHVIQIHVEPDYMDSSWLAFIYKDQILLSWTAKAWHFCWGSVGEMTEWMEQQRRTLHERYHARWEMATDFNAQGWCVYI